MADIVVLVDDYDVNASLLALESRISPGGIRRFLAGAAREFLQSRVDARFAAEGDDAVGKWAQLRRNTAGIRAAQGFRPYHPINVRTGELYDFVRNTFYLRSDRGAETIVMPGKGKGDVMDKLRVAQHGSASKTAVTGQWGVTGPKQNVPAVPRPVVGVNETDLAAIVGLLKLRVDGVG
jgi:hypothetical protein